MIAVIEGIDRVGKTTLANKLVDGGFVYLKDEFILNNEFVKNFPDYSLGKCDSFVAIAKALDKAGKNVVIDRLHLTELAYGTELRNNVNAAGCYAIDMALANLGAVLYLVIPTDINLSNELAGIDQTKLNDLISFYYRMSSMEKCMVTYERIDEVANSILNRANKYDFYFASPFFNDEQVEREERMIKHLRDNGFTVFSPKEECKLDSNASQQSRQEVFNNNCEAIRNSRAVFAVTDGKDMGTIWEAGYAYGINKPVIYYAETLGDGQFNLMLAQSGRDVYCEQGEASYGSLIDSLNGVRRKYRGEIE